MKDPELTLTGLTDDGTKLVLVSREGAEFTLPVDDALRAAVAARQGAAARTGQWEKTMDSTLRPRDIQARIRAGETPEAVADAAKTTLDRVMSYATPVLAERAHIAERAQRASVRRRGGEGSSRVLAEAVAATLRADNVDPESIAWDAWRREDGRWSLVADLAAGRRAEFVFDAPGRYVVADNDEARVLVGEQAAASATPTTGPTGPASGRRLAAVATADDELPLGEDAIGLVHEEEQTVDLTPAVRAVRSPEPEPHGDPVTEDLPAARTSADPVAPRGDADWIATQATDRPAPAAEEVPAEEPDAAEEPAPSRKPARKGRGRASVPSWDEIMFGGGRRD